MQEALKLGTHVEATAGNILTHLGGRDAKAFLEDLACQLVLLKKHQRREKIHALRTCFRHHALVMQTLQMNIIILVACNKDSNKADQIACVATEVDSHLHEFLSAVEESTFVERAGRKGIEDGGFSFRDTM